VAGRLGAAYPCYAIKNDSVNGRTAEELLPVTRELTGQYDLILLQIGANDLMRKRPLDAVLNDMSQLIKNVRPHAEQVVILTSGNIGGATAFDAEQQAFFTELSRQYDQRMQAVTADIEAVRYVSLFSEPDSDPFVASPDTYLSWDGLHPSSEGYKLWYETAARDAFSKIVTSC
jgi:lysophospholipase L1-like esterase